MTDKDYYNQSIAANAAKNNGDVTCEECGLIIPYATGRNVCHVIGKGAEIRLYHHPENHFILCHTHAAQEETHHKKNMRIYPEWLEKYNKLKSIKFK
jgi:hypothetical protein